MSTYQITTRKSSQALAGQAVIVTLNNADAGALSLFSEGNLATADTSGKTGLIERVDLEGSSFTVTPIQPNKTFDSGVYGYLANGQTVTITY